MHGNGRRWAYGNVQGVCLGDRCGRTPLFAAQQCNRTPDASVSRLRLALLCATCQARLVLQCAARTCLCRADTTPPSITCGYFSMEKGTSQAIADATTVTDASAPITVTCTPSDTAGLAVGLNAVTCKATDSSGNWAECNVPITVLGALARLVYALCVGGIARLKHAMKAPRSCLRITQILHAQCGSASPPPRSRNVLRRSDTVVPSLVVGRLIQERAMCAAYTGTFSTYAAACTVLTLPSLADTSVPTIICPGAISAELGTSNAITASAMDASSTEVSCTPANTMDLPAGRHASVCTARDDVNLVATCNVDVTVTGALRSSNTGHVHPYPIALRWIRRLKRFLHALGSISSA